MVKSTVCNINKTAEAMKLNTLLSHTKVTITELRNFAPVARVFLSGVR